MRGRYRNDHYEGYWSDPELGYRRARRRTPRYRPSGKRRDRYRRYAGRHPRYRYQYIAYDAGASEPRRRSRGWRRYLDRIGLFKERSQRRWGRRGQEYDQDLITRGRRFAKKYKEPIVGAALAGVSLPMALGVAEPAQELEDEEGRTRIGEARLTGRPFPRSDLEEDVRSRIASLREGRIREATIEGAMTAYNISRNLAEQIHDTAVANDIEPELAFGLVKTESSFDDRAVSNVGARGLTQVMPRTARWLRPGTTIEDLYNRSLNLDLGFGYLRDLIDKYDGDTRLALLAYNRGPGTVDRVLSEGGDPDNGYADLVLEGYTDLS